MPAPQRVLPVIDYDSAGPSPWPQAMRMMGTIGIALGLLRILDGVVCGSWNLPAPRIFLVSLTLPLSLLLVAGSIGSFCLRPWGRTLLMVWACVAAMHYADHYLVLKASDGIIDQSASVYLGTFSFCEWLKFFLFPLMIFLLLWPQENCSKMTSGDSTAARRPLQKMLRGIGILGVAIGILTAFCITQGWRYYFRQTIFTDVPESRILASLWTESGLCILLVAAGIGSWHLKPYGRWLFVIYAITTEAYRIIIGQTQHPAWWTLRELIMVWTKNILGVSPFSLVIILLMFRRQIRDAFHHE
jgi:hypothetical protein